MRDIFTKVFKGEKTMNWLEAGQIPQKVEDRELGRPRPGLGFLDCDLLDLSDGSFLGLSTDDARGRLFSFG